MTEPKITAVGTRNLVGIRIQTSLSENRTYALWHQFKPRVMEIKNRKNTVFFSVQNFPDNLKIHEFTDDTPFEKWAAVEVDEFDLIPVGMESYVLPGGKYAVFVHLGPVSTAHQTFEQIFEHWLPNSAFELDHRPHFEIMKDHYRPDDPNAEEEVWIPIKSKN